MKYFYLNSFFWVLLLSTSLSAQSQLIVQKDNFDDENTRLNWTFENTHQTNPIDWVFTDNNGQNIDGTTMAYFYDDETLAHESIGVGRMVSPSVNLTDAIYVELSFDYNYQQRTTLVGSTTFRVEVFDGINWQTVWTRNEDDCGAWENCGVFSRATVDVTDLVNDNFQVRFVYDDGGLVAFFAAVDNYELRAAYDCELLLPHVTYRLVDECSSSARTYTCEFTVSNLIVGDTIGIDIFNDGTLFAQREISNNGTYRVSDISECTYTEVRRDCSFQARKYGCDCDDMMLDFDGDILCCKPFNDDCVGAIDIGNGEFYQHRMPNSATNSGFDSSCNDNNPNNDIWFKRPAPASGYLEYGLWGNQFGFQQRIMYSEVYVGECDNLNKVLDCGIADGTSNHAINSLPTTGDIYFRVWGEGRDEITELQFYFNEDPCRNLPFFDASIQVADCETALEYDVSIFVNESFAPIDILVNNEVVFREVNGRSGEIYSHSTALQADGTILVEVRFSFNYMCSRSITLEDPCNICEPPRNDECSNAEFIGTTVESDITINVNLECATATANEEDLLICDAVVPQAGGVWYFIEGNFNDMEQPRGIRFTANGGQQLYAFAGNNCSFGCPSGLSGQGTNQVVFLANNQTANKGDAALMSYYIYVVAEDQNKSNMSLLYESKSGNFAPALSLSWLGFSVNVSDDYNKLLWQVAEEQNTAYYQIERLENGTDNWKIIGEMRARNLTHPQQYEFLDNHPFVDTYYRIVNVDNDGLKSISPIKNVVRSDDFSTQLLPNPVMNKVTIKWNQLPSLPIEIRIFNLNGQLLRREFYHSNKATQQVINLQTLSAGVYMMQINNGERQQMQRFVKY